MNFSFVLTKVFAAGRKHNTKKKTCFESLIYVISYCVNQNIKQNIREYILHSWFYETSMEILRA